MNDILIVVDMQNDFIDGALGTPEAVAIVPNVLEKIKGFEGRVIFTRDTHLDNYMDTQEGKNLPVPHCIKGSEGWQLHPLLAPFANAENRVEKPSFGSFDLIGKLRPLAPDAITCVGLCTDICVLSVSTILKAAFRESVLTVDAACCAGVTPQSHETALRSLSGIQIEILNA